MSATRGRDPLLAPALAAARRALQRLDSDEIPAGVRKVAAYSGGRLPPPLARKLTEELDASGWLRDKALDDFDDPDVDSVDAAHAASSLFLARPDRWWIRFAGLENDRATTVAEGESLRLAASLAAADERLAETRRRLKAVTAERDEIVRGMKEAVDQERRRVGEASADHRSRLAEAAASSASAAEALAGERAAREEVERFAARLREELRRARRDRSDLARRLGSGETSVGREPRALARSLDELAARARPSLGRPASATVDEPARAGVLALPAGVSPDQAAAVNWLAAEDEAFLLLVDGYNVAFQLSPTDFTSSVARRRVNVELARVAARLRSKSPVVVIYDSGLEGERAVAPGERGVEVVFAEAGRLADEELVARAAEASGRVVVVSTDREVREQATAAGALALWSEALVGWLRRAS